MSWSRRPWVRALNEGQRGLGQAVACEVPEGAALSGSFDEIYGWSGGMRQTETCDLDSAVNSVPAQSACLVSNSNPASCAIKSSSAGQM